MLTRLTKGCLEDVFIFSNQTQTTSKVHAEPYLLPYTALAYANVLRKLNYDVILVFDDVVEHHLKELLLFSSMDQPFVSFPCMLINKANMILGSC